MLVKQVMSTTPVTSAPQATLQEIAMLMWNNDCGAVPLVDGEGHPAGMVTDRDIAMGAALQNNALSAIRGEQVGGHREVVCCGTEDPIEDALELMEGHQIRRLPVLNPFGQVCGMLSMGDVLACTGAPGERPGAQPDGSVAVGQALDFLKRVSSHHRSHKEIASAAQW